MQIKSIKEPARSPVPGVIPDPVTLHEDPAPARRGVARSRRASGRRSSSPGGDEPSRTLLATVLGLMRRNSRSAAPPTQER